MIKNKVATVAKYTVLSAMMAVSQVARSNNSTKSPETKEPEKIQSTQKYVYQRDEGFMYQAPLLITPTEGMQMACAFSTMSDLQFVKDGKAVPVHVEKITKMPAAGKQIILNNLTAVKEMKGAWDRINKYMQDKGIENFGAPSGQLPKAFREDINGILTTWLVDTKAKITQEFSFDKEGREVSPDKVGPAKRYYRYHADTFNFLCARTANNGYLAIEVNQMEHPCPTFTYRDGKGINYVSLGGAAFIDDGKTIRAYRGTTQQLQREQKAQELAKKSR